MIAVVILAFDWKINNTDGKPRQDMKKIVFYAAGGVNVSGSDHVVGWYQDREVRVC